MFYSRSSDSATRRRFLKSSASVGAAWGLTGAVPGRFSTGSHAAADGSADGSGLRLDTTPDTYVLFLDMQEVEDLFLCEQVVNKATKHPNNPVLDVGNVEDWDSDRAGNWAGSLIYDPSDKLFKIWYYGRDYRTASRVSPETSHSGIGYAYSEDGAYWHKPKLGLYEYNGSKDNNICFRSPDGHASHFCVVQDPQESDSNRRFQALIWMPVAADGSRSKGMAYIAHYCADGIHWKRAGDGVEWPNGDTGYVIIDEQDVPERRFKAYGQHICGTGPDIESMKYVGVPLSPSEGTEHEIHFVYTDRYRNDYFPMLYDFNRYRPYYGQLGYHMDSPNQTRQDRVQKRVALGRGSLPAEERLDEYGIYVGDIRLAVSRDGTGKFQRVQPTTPVVARGARNAWDSGFLVLGGGSMIVENDQIYIFYTGLSEYGSASFPGLAKGRIAMGLATLRLDGFTHMQARDVLTPGTLTTRPIEVKNADRARLTLNVSDTLPWRDWVEVEVLDAATGKPVEGYSRQQAVGVMRDGLKAPVQWTKQNTLAGVNVPQVRLRFHFYGRARLYSYTFNTG